MGNQQSNAGAAQFFAGVTDIITKPVNVFSNIATGKDIIPSASQAVAESKDVNINPNASVVAAIQKFASKGGPPPNMRCRPAKGQDTPTLNTDTNVWYCGTGNDGDRASRQRTQPYGASGGVIGNSPTPGPTDQWNNGRGNVTTLPVGARYNTNTTPNNYWQARLDDGVTPPGMRAVPMPNGIAPRSDDPESLNPQFNLAGTTDSGTKVVLGGDANSLSATQAFPKSVPAPTPMTVAPVPAMDNTSLIMIGGAVVIGAVLLAKKK
jgi:hypothetical protein